MVTQLIKVSTEGRWPLCYDQALKTGGCFLCHRKDKRGELEYYYLVYLDKENNGGQPIIPLNAGYEKFHRDGHLRGSDYVADMNFYLCNDEETHWLMTCMRENRYVDPCGGFLSPENYPIW